MDLTINADRFSGKDNVKIYDNYRPTPPEALINLTKQYVGGRINHMVDVGCGSGLSTEVWLDDVESITAVDPSADMLDATKKKLIGRSNAHAIQAFAHDIPLDDGSADLLTCSQAFHWMDPLPTLTEINRILQKEGVLVIYDCLWPPSVHPIWEQAFITLFDGIKEISEHQSKPLMHFWDKSKHINNVQNSGYFKYVKQVGFHKEVIGGGDYFIGLAESQGGLHALRKIGMSDKDIGWERFKNTITNTSLREDALFMLNYTAIFAIK